MKWWARQKLKTKFWWLIGVGLLIWQSNFMIVYFEINRINQATLDLEKREDLYNSVLEVRRFEKNYFLYHHRQSLEEAVSQLHHARNVLASISSQAGPLQNQKQIQSLEVAMDEYDKLAVSLGKLAPLAASGQALDNDIRDAGKTMVNMARQLLEEGRHQIASAAHRALRWPVISMGLILVLFCVGAVMIHRKIIKPLARLEQATEEIGRGNFAPIRHPDRIESEVDRLILAFNRMAEELESRQEQIIHSRKIASLGTLVSGVAHELNNPINNIILSIDSMMSGRKMTPERRATMENDILSQALRASEIVKNLLDFSRSETAMVEDLDIGKLLKDTARISKNQMAVNKIEFRQDIGPDLPVVRGNRQALQQVFINLLTNAVQAMPEGGRLSVTASRDDGRVVITVSDTGCGIAKEDLPRIFDPFFTTKEVGAGTGLGLSVSYGIIKKHGGRISVESSPGKGSQFTIVLPGKKEMIDG